MCYLLLSCWWNGVETLFLTEDIADVLSLVGGTVWRRCFLLRA